MTKRVLAGSSPSRFMLLSLIEPGKLNQNAYIESFNGRLRNELSQLCVQPDAAMVKPSVTKPPGNSRHSSRTRCDTRQLRWNASCRSPQWRR
ncbi:transposase [Rhodanobacter hydrolyticus]|uniref:Transposase n=1 Tax=Rhodanobacter hydrolyticus TaxID=2250595 RepID=A0ABW8J1J9_9GAMM